MSSGTIAQVNISGGGVPKLPVPVAEVGTLGLAGDVQRDKVHHGGPDRAVCLFSLERLQALAAEGHPIGPGSTGENITTSGIDWDQVVIGTRLRLGSEVILEITGHAPPCRTNLRFFQAGNFNRINHRLHPGWSRTYARVLNPGTVRPGDPIELLGSSHVDGDQKGKPGMLMGVS